MSKSATSQTLQKAPVAVRPAPSGILQRKCACGNHTVAGGECAECGKEKNSLQRKALDRLSASRLPIIQTKLTVGSSSDPLEQEADRIADQVMSRSPHSAVSGTPLRIQRFSGYSAADGVAAPASVDLVLSSSGRPLEPALRQDMEQRFGHDFSHVRVHSGAAAAQSAEDANARAYTVGHNVVFGAGSFAPGTQHGRRLLAHELTHVVQQTGTTAAPDGARNDARLVHSSSRGIDGMIRRQPSPEPESPRQKVRKVILDKQQNVEIFELENRYESLPLIDHCDPLPGNYTARVENDRDKPGKRKWITNQNIGCKKPLGYIVRTVQGSKFATLEGVQQIDFEVRDSEQSARNTAAIRKFFTTDKGERASADDLEKIAQAEYILEKSGVTADELLLLEQQQLEAKENGQTFEEAEDPAAWATQFVQGRQQAGEKALATRTDLVKARTILDTWTQDEKNGIKNVVDGVVKEEVMHMLLRRYKLSYHDLIKAFEFELRSITDAFLSQAQIALYQIERKYLAGKNVGVEKEALRQAIEKIQPFVAERDTAASKRDSRKDKVTLYGLVPDLTNDPELAKAEAEVKTKDEELKRQSAEAGLPVVSWKGFDFDAIKTGDVEASRSELRQFVAHAHSQIRTAKKKVENLSTLYKADRMVAFTKAALGITKGSVFDDIITYRAKVDLSDDSFWSTLWNIVTIALMFVPGNIGLVLRVAAGVVDATKAMDELSEGSVLHGRELSSAAPSKLGVFLAVGGTLIDVPQMAKGFVRVLDTEAALAGKAASRTESAIVSEVGETTVKTGDDVVKGAVHARDESTTVVAGSQSRTGYSKTGPRTEDDIASDASRSRRPVGAVDRGRGSRPRYANDPVKPKVTDAPKTKVAFEPDPAKLDTATLDQKKLELLGPPTRERPWHGRLEGASEGDPRLKGTKGGKDITDFDAVENGVLLERKTAVNAADPKDWAEKQITEKYENLRQLRAQKAREYPEYEQAEIGFRFEGGVPDPQFWNAVMDAIEALEKKYGTRIPWEIV